MFNKQYTKYDLIKALKSNWFIRKSIQNHLLAEGIIADLERLAEELKALASAL